MNKLPKLHLAASTDDLRPAMQCIKIEGQKAIVTEGHMIIVFQRLHDFFEKDILEFLDGKMIHKDIWKMICECNYFSVSSDQFSCLYKGQWIAFPHLSQVEGKYPAWESVFPNKQKEINNVVGLNPFLIGKIATVFRSTYIFTRWTLNDQNKAVKFEAEDGDFYGLIMPLSLNPYN